VLEHRGVSAQVFFGTLNFQNPCVFFAWNADTTSNSPNMIINADRGMGF
jgi:hypothetical protein